MTHYELLSFIVFCDEKMTTLDIIMVIWFRLKHFVNIDNPICYGYVYGPLEVFAGQFPDPQNLEHLCLPRDVPDIWLDELSEDSMRGSREERVKISVRLTACTSCSLL